MATKKFCDICGSEVSRVCSTKAEELNLCMETDVDIKAQDRVFDDGATFSRSIYIGIAVRNKEYGDTDICRDCVYQALQLAAIERAFYSACSDCKKFDSIREQFKDVDLNPYQLPTNEEYIEVCGACTNPSRRAMIDMNNDDKFRFKSSAFKYCSSLKFEDATASDKQPNKTEEIRKAI